MLLQSLFHTRQAKALHALSFGREHARVLAALAVLLLAGSGATAYAISQAQKSTQDILGSITQVVEPVTPLPQSNETLAAADFTLYRSDRVRRAESNASLLKRLGVQDAQALHFINQQAATKKLAGYVGRRIEVQTNPQGELEKLLLRYPQGDGQRFTRLIIERNAQHALGVREESAYLQAEPRLAYATVHGGSIYATMDGANIPEVVGNQLVDIFASEIDFQRTLKRGDSFKVLYETLQADGEVMGTGRVLAAEFVNSGQVYSAVWYKPSDGSSGAGGYYSLEGQSLHKAYLAAPLKFTRITSGFGMREHPIWHGLRPHKGVDYGAPIGTPVMSMADGVVKFAGWQTGYGNCVEVQHRNGRSTFYAHMSKITVHAGEKLPQGTQVGNVGATGWATGPHLHFEFRINGEYQQPELMAQEPSTAPLASPTARREFAALADTMRLQFANARAVQLARGQ